MSGPSTKSTDKNVTPDTTSATAAQPAGEQVGAGLPTATTAEPKAATKGAAKRHSKPKMPPPPTDAWADPERLILGLLRSRGGQVRFVMGTDEVGRGSLAGPLCTATSVFALMDGELPSEAAKATGLQAELLSSVNDSKKLTAKTRERLLDALSLYLDQERLAAAGETPGPRDLICPASLWTDAARPIARTTPSNLLRYGPDSPWDGPETNAEKTATPGVGFRRVTPKAPVEATTHQNGAPWQTKEVTQPYGGALVLIGVAVAEATAEEIDRFGLTVANNLAMNRSMLRAADFIIGMLPAEKRADKASALREIAIQTLHIVDGDAEALAPSPFRPTWQALVVKGDGRLKSVGLASVVAKVARDDLMEHLGATEYPQYGFEQHAGYGTQKHYAAIQQHGVLPIHRRSFLKRR